MISKFEKVIYKILTNEPVTPNEVARKLKISYKTAQRVLLQLALTHDEIRYKNSGRVHLFWKETQS